MPVIPGKPPNGDGCWSDFSGLYAKALKHDHPGIPKPRRLQGFPRGAEARGNHRRTGRSQPPLFEPRNAAPRSLLTPLTREATPSLTGRKARFVIQPFGEQSPDYVTRPRRPRLVRTTTRSS